MRPLATKLLGAILLLSAGGCCIRPVGVYTADYGYVDVGCTDYHGSCYHDGYYHDGYYHRSSPRAAAPCPPSGVAPYRAPGGNGHHPAPPSSHGNSGAHGNGHGPGNGSAHPGSNAQGYRGNQR